MPDTLESEPIPKDRPIYWDHNGETSIDPPSDAIRAVIFAPPPDKTNRAGVESIGETLSKRGFAIWLTEISETVDVRQIFSAIDTSSVFITISNPYLLDNNESLAVLRSALTYAASKGKTRHYGISLDGISILTDIIRYVADASTVTLTEDSRRVAAQVANTYFAEMAGANVREEATKERRERLERNASDFVDEALATLQDRERRWKRAAYGWHSVGFFALLAGIVAVIYLSAQSLPTVAAPEKAWPVIAYLTLKSIIIIGLLVASSKYAFTLGRSYMNEALKNADRIHAINFGRFYLKAYGESAAWIDVKEVFQTWNIARESGFASLDTSQFDPQLLSTAVEIAKSLAPAIKKEVK